MNKGLIGLIISIIILFVALFIIIYNKKPRTLDITYKINAGIPFKWEYSIEDESIVKLKKSYVTKNENKGAIVGAPIHRKYIFEGLKEGKTTITFKYVNVTKEMPNKEEKYYVKVDKNKNVELLKK